MPFEELAADFNHLKRVRRVDPRTSLELAGEFGTSALRVLLEHAEPHPMTWKGGGGKRYHVYTAHGSPLPFSRPVNESLFEGNPDTFGDLWKSFVAALVEAEKSGTRQVAIERSSVDRAVYSAVIGYGAAVDIFNAGNRGGPGSFLEMVIGPVLAMLTGRPESGALRLKVPGSADETELIPVDLTYIDDEEPIVLVVPTKISSRERISQAAVHQRILDAIGGPGRYRSILCLANENNVMPERGVPKAERTAERCFARDTLVPGTIALYQKYIAKLYGLYYLDPPFEYITGKYSNLPPIRNFGNLLTSDLPGLLQVE